MDFSHVDMNTIITISAFLFSLITQIVMWAYSTGKASQMIEILRRDLDEHKRDTEAKRTKIESELLALTQRKNDEHAEFKTKIATHDQMFSNLNQNMAELKESNREILAIIRELGRK